jgi:hypothetical protein
VAYFADLTPYGYWVSSLSYSPERDEPWPGLPLVNVGWLDTDHPFPTGPVPDGLLVKLDELAKARVMQTRGHHYCQLCIRDLGGEPQLESLDLDARIDLYVSLPRESAEFRVKGDGVVYAVPQLALHYIDAHQYQPPAEFCDAVMTSAPGPTGGSPKPVGPVVIDDYYEALALHKMLMVAKFESDVDNIYVGSPFVAAVQRRLVEALQAATPGPGCAQWRDAGAHEWRLPKVRAYLARTLPSVAVDKRREFLLDVLAPLLPSNELVAELLAGYAE